MVVTAASPASPSRYEEPLPRRSLTPSSTLSGKRGNAETSEAGHSSASSKRSTPRQTSRRSGPAAGEFPEGAGGGASPMVDEEPTTVETREKEPVVEEGETGPDLQSMVDNAKDDFSFPPQRRRAPRPRSLGRGYGNPRRFGRGREARDQEGDGSGDQDLVATAPGRIFPPRRGGRGRFFRGRPNRRNFYSLPTVPLAAVGIKDWDGAGEGASKLYGVVPYCPIHYPLVPVVKVAGSNFRRGGGRGFRGGRGGAGRVERLDAGGDGERGHQSEDSGSEEGDKGEDDMEKTVQAEDELDEAVVPQGQATAPPSRGAQRNQQQRRKRRRRVGGGNAAVEAKDDEENARARGSADEGADELDELKKFAASFVANLSAANVILSKLEKIGVL